MLVSLCSLLVSLVSPVSLASHVSSLSSHQLMLMGQSQHFRVIAPPFWDLPSDHLSAEAKGGTEKPEDVKSPGSQSASRDNAASGSPPAHIL